MTHQFVDWFRMFARGGASILYVGNSSIDITECKDEECQLDLANPHCVLPLSWYAEMAQEFDCHASLEVNHNGKDTTLRPSGMCRFPPAPSRRQRKKCAPPCRAARRTSPSKWTRKRSTRPL